MEHLNLKVSILHCVGAVQSCFLYRLIGLTLHYCSKAVYRKHRLPLALQLALSLTSVPDIEKNFLLGEAVLNDDEDSDYRVPEWITEERRTSVRALASSLPQVKRCF